MIRYQFHPSALCLEPDRKFLIAKNFVLLSFLSGAIRVQSCNLVSAHYFPVCTGSIERELVMQNKIRLHSKSKKSVSGSANVLIDSLPPFNGSVLKFLTDGKEVLVSANQQFDEKRSASLSISFPESIDNKEHDYVKDGGIDIIYVLIEKDDDGETYTPYSAVYGSGKVTVAFDLERGTFHATFNLKVQNDPTEPQLGANGAFRDVQGLEHVQK